VSEEVFIGRIKAEQARYALDSLKSPGNKTEGDVGHRVGYVAGLERALMIVHEMLDEARRDDDKDL
jgi:hypothetical protein